MPNIPFRISALNIPDDLSPLKLRGYLQREAANIQRLSGGKGYTIIRLFLPERLRLQFTQKKLDVLLQSIVDKHPAIHRVELERTERPLTLAEMVEVGRQEEAFMDAALEGARQMEIPNGTGAAINLYGDQRVATSTGHGIDIASQRADDLDLMAVEQVQSLVNQ